MKPINLELLAFGPYKDRVNVDFKNLQQRGLFAITGPTGAGKTTIFDAICFALFGEASGENRNDQALLRSHFADDEVYTSVELRFELKGKQYIIFRQRGHQKKQNKGVTGDKIEFYKIENDEKVPYCQEFNKTSIVNKKVEELLGINADQFKQIVLLPQGEFRKLLVSDTKDKEEILRKIFRTELYDKVKDAIGTVKSQISKENEQIKQIIRIKLEVVQELLFENGIDISKSEELNIHQIQSILTDHSTILTDELKLMAENEKLLKEKVESKQQKLFSAEKHNENINRLNVIKELLGKLVEEEVQIQQKKKQLIIAQQAEKVVPYEADLKRLTNHLKQTNEKLMHESNLLEEVKIKIDQLANEMTTLPLKKKDLLSAENQISTLQEVKNVLVEYDLLKENFSKANTQFQVLEQEEKAIKVKVEVVKEKVTGLKNELESLSNVNDLWTEKSILKQKMHLKGGLVKRIVTAITEVSQTLSKQESLKKQVDESMAEVQKIEAEILQQKSAVLAKELKENEACPVCGSLHHPVPATFTGNIHEEEYNVKKEKTINLQNELSVLIGQVTQQQAAIETDKLHFYEEFGEFEFTKESLLAFADEYNQVALELKQLEEKKAVAEQLNKQIKSMEMDLEKLSQVHSEKTNLVEKYHQKVNELKLNLVQLESKLPEDLKTLEEWTKRVLEFEKKIKELSTYIQTIEKTSTELTEQKTIKETTCQHLQTELLRLENEVKQSSNLFDMKLNEYDFKDASQFEEAVKYISFINQYQKDITKFDEERSRLETEKDVREKQSTSMELIDTTLLSEELKLLKIQVDGIVNELIKIEEQNKKTIHLKEELTNYYSEFLQSEQQLSNLTALYNVTKGDNDKMVSFERYVLLDYFEQIIESANLRLDHLSNGQYQLQRKDMVEKGRKQSGLGLEVYDSYTGLARDVKTLSGGEQFNASLCLALGMADIIQAHQGGVTIDTLFIDEGFGSLDDELLTKAIDTLIQLQKTGRLIGVISHVQEVKDAMPAIIEVRKTNQGHSELSVVLK
ncbi:SMC family ATPase [Bacillus sp. RG28]|uniref:Nuclease SbcCD subunit C n=1 Tax=Gottfriedia endophytica TaxID=2820819 RepID=A0A940NL69_9BACI|nr:SMC family ATPase [Gottfriedia endophytica]MBP0726490.1 SMC family ATPase [Gottfriedia endophytica]